MREELYGYTRVSSRDQNLARQTLALREFGVSEKQIYTDMQSGENFYRPGYQRLLKALSRATLL